MPTNGMPLWKVGLLLLAGWLAVANPQGCPLPNLPDIVSPSKADAVTYFFEKNQGSAPPAVQVALDKLNRQGIIATEHEVDTTDGSGDVPEQYKVSLPAAKAAGLPSLVVTGGGKVVRTVKAPTTEAEVLGAVK